LHGMYNGGTSPGAPPRVVHVVMDEKVSFSSASLRAPPAHPPGARSHADSAHPEPRLPVRLIPRLRAEPRERLAAAREPRLDTGQRLLVRLPPLGHEVGEHRDGRNLRLSNRAVGVR
jgi:hypothetical protein